MDSVHQHGQAAPGRMVDIGGLRLHAIVCGEGRPAVVLEPALGGFALQYSHVQPAVSAFTRVLAYDRAGQGWSDASAEPRTPAQIGLELRALLQGLDIQPPYVLVGHSFGGLLTLTYAASHPGEVAGIVLVDSTHPDEYEPFPDIDKFVGRMGTMVRLMKLGSRLGLGRQLAKLSLGPPAKSLSKEDLEAFVSVTSRPRHHDTMLAEFAQHRCYYGPQSEVPRTLGDMPLIVVTAGKSVSGPAKMGKLTGDEMNALHQNLQRKLLQLSTRAEQILVPDATHLSILMQAEHAAQVVAAITKVVQLARRGNGWIAPTPL